MLLMYSHKLLEDKMPGTKKQFEPLPGININIPGLTGTQNTNASATGPSIVKEGTNRPDTDGSRVGNPTQITQANAVEKQKETNAMYNNKQQQEDLDVHAGRQNQIVNDFAMSPEQWYKMYGYWDWNLAKDNPNGNLNSRTYGQTLAASRLADALNNKRHWRAAKIGRRTNSSFGTNEYTPGYSERWEPIETQETRQMRANEAMDLAARQRQVNRAENIQDYPLELQKMSDRTRSELTKYASQTGIDLQRAMQAGKWKAEYGDNWNTFYTNFIAEFGRELDLRTKEKVLEKMTLLKYPFSNAWMQLNSGAAPNPIEQALWQYIETIGSTIQDPKAQAEFKLGGGSMLVQMFTRALGKSFESGLGW